MKHLLIRLFVLLVPFITFTVYLIKHKAVRSNDGVDGGLSGFTIQLLVCMAIILLLGALLSVETAVFFLKGSHHNAWRNLVLILFFAAWYIFLMTLG